MSLYARRGVSAQKEEVHAATQHMDKGLFPHSFCKLTEDILGGDKNWVNVMHADGAGTKAVLAYLYWRETGNLDVWKGIAQDAIVMNLDDLLCVGICDKILFSSSIDRNKKLIPGEVLKALIEGTQEFFDQMRKEDIDIHFMGGETADVGDVVRTVAVNGTMTARWPANKVITNENIAAGQVIVGFESSGQASYESDYNSGIGSNGLTSARHDILQQSYGKEYPESVEPSLRDDVAYIGKHRLSDQINVIKNEKNISRTVGELILSPTRTYAPLVKRLLEEKFESIYGMIHCSGGGQTKCLKYVSNNVRIVKNNLFDPPEIFKIIQQGSGADEKEMYQVFNMGSRLEIFTSEAAATQFIDISSSYGIEAKVIGHVESSDQKELRIELESGSLIYC